MSASPVVAEHLSKTFGRGRGITDVSLRVEDGQVVGFLGPNGAGKSTTLKMLAGFLPALREAVQEAAMRALGHALHI